MDQSSEPTPPPIQEASRDHGTSINNPIPTFILTEGPKRGLHLDGRQRSTVVICAVVGIAVCLCMWWLLHGTTGISAKSFSYKLIDDPPSGQTRIRSVGSVGRSIQASLLRQHYRTVAWQAVVVNSTREAFEGHVVVTFRGEGNAVIGVDRVFVQLASRETSRVSNELRIRIYQAEEIIDASCEVRTDQ